MKTTMPGALMTTFSICLLTALSLLAQGAADKTRDETAIREIVKKYVAARERGDAHAIEALFATDADQLTSSGEWRRGRDEVVRGTMASSQRSTGTRSITLETVRFPAAGIAVADGRYEIAGAQGGSSRKMWTTLILIRGTDGWRIAAIRNMLPAGQ
jgi:uncharacterized protein (TIGR02246 family)